MNQRTFESDEQLSLEGQRLSAIDENHQKERISDLVIDHANPIRRGIGRVGWLRFRVDGFKDVGQMENAAMITLVATDGLSKDQTVGPSLVPLIYERLGQAS